MKVLSLVVIVGYIAFNFLVSRALSAEQMKQRLISNQCVVGMICANVFYAPAWCLKGIKFACEKFIK